MGQLGCPLNYTVDGRMGQIGCPLSQTVDSRMGQLGCPLNQTVNERMGQLGCPLNQTVDGKMSQLGCPLSQTVDGRMGQLGCPLSQTVDGRCVISNLERLWMIGWFVQMDDNVNERAKQSLQIAYNWWNDKDKQWIDNPTNTQFILYQKGFQISHI